MTKGILLASYGRMYETKVHYFHNLKLISVANSKQCEHNYLESLLEILCSTSVAIHA